MSRQTGATGITEFDVEPGDRALSQARAFEKRARGIVQPLTGKFAWWTLVHFLASFSHRNSRRAGHRRAFAYWVAAPLNAILIYFMFAPLHEATHDNIVGPDSRLGWLASLIGHVSGSCCSPPMSDSARSICITTITPINRRKIRTIGSGATITNTRRSRSRLQLAGTYC